MICQRTNQNAVDAVGFDISGWHTCNKSIGAQRYQNEYEQSLITLRLAYTM